MFAPPSQANEKKESESNNFQSRAPALSLPKGGGAIRGMGEKFAANPVTGTGSMTAPIATSPGRSGFGPQLSLSYDSGAGNGPFGFGWSLSLPAITRKTDKGLPKYQDADESDVFILSGAEDLVPVLVEKGGKWQPEALPPRTVEGKTYRIQRYRPRIEGLFARIERWTNQADPTETFWRSISKDNITTWYGKTPESRIVDPSDATSIFSWLICQSHDDKGNVIVYGYKAENADDIDLSQAHERNRGDTTDKLRSANRYLKRIRYGNHKPYFPILSASNPWPSPSGAEAPDGSTDWFFEVVFDYGDHDLTTPLPQEPGKQWPVRSDPFSTYRAGFEVRTYRLCQRVLMFHHFPGEDGVGQDYLVRSTDFFYSDEKDRTDPRNPIYSFLLSVTQTGYKRQGTGYLSKSLPSLDFEYTLPNIDPTVREIDGESVENLPYGLDTSRYQWADLNGEGLSGVLTEQAGSWFYKRNLSPITTRTEQGREVVIARFAPVEHVMQQPSLAALSNGRQQFLDLAGDGQLDLVELDAPTPGFFERTPDESWEPFTPFTALPVRDWSDPNLKFVDLTGDGHADILITEDDVLCWHPSLAEAGFGPPERVRQSLDEEKGPKLIVADGTQSIHLADLSGDGLTDLVRIRNGEVCYWPNLGYGRFGAKVTMDDAPWFEAPELFDGRRIRLADIDGSGTTDIMYLSSDGVQIYFNQSGNGWGAKHTLNAFPQVDNLSAVTALDLLGNGTACLVWSSPLPGDVRRPMRYIDLMGGNKPHLMVKSANNLGAETHVQYAPSTKFYVADKLAGIPWITKIPFPVHVVERIETHDHVSRNRFVTRYAYHHGYFDGVEREFRGFGRVDQWDTEQFTSLASIGGEGWGEGEATNIDEASHVPPVLSKTWFHTGVYLGRDRVSNFFAGLLDANDKGEYYREPGLSDAQAAQRLLDDTVLPDDLILEEEREACRALKGAMLRQEVYALDGTDQQEHPYVVTEQNFTIERLQPQAGNRHGVFFTHPREALSYHYERNPQDPRVSHALTLEVDEFGNVLKSVAIGYGRRTSNLTEAFDRNRQTLRLITYTENGVTNPINEPDNYRTPLPAETRTYELTGYTLPGGQDRFTSSDFVRNNQERLEHVLDAEINYEEQPTTGRERRLIEHVRTTYRKDNLTAFLPLGELNPLALPGESYKLAFTPRLLSQVYRRGSTSLLQPNAASILAGQGADEGGYVAGEELRNQGLFPATTDPRATRSDADGHWWILSGKVFFDVNADVANPANTAPQELTEARQHFYLPRKFVNPFNHAATVDYDTPKDLLIVKTQDAVGNTVSAQHEYRVLQPTLMTDPNGNRSEVAFDTLGMVAGTAVMGKTSAVGDNLTGFQPDLTNTEVDGFYDVADPHVPAPALLKGATTRIVYDLHRFKRTRDADPQDPTKWRSAYAATLARETHASDPVPPGGLKIQISFSYSDGFGREIQKKIQAEPGPAPTRDASGVLKCNSSLVPADPRWVGTGRTIYNNKGKPVKQYEPFFSPTHHYETEKDLVECGVTLILFYDPVERVVATLHPNHSYEKVVFVPWQQTTYDVNDTVAANGTETGDPRTDPDIRGYVREYFKTQPATWATWHQQRIGGALGAEERSAAEQAAKHANTPTVAHFDTLGRAFHTIAHNRFDRNNAVVEENYSTRVVLDIEGNQRAVRDAVVQAGDQLGRIVMQYDYDMLGNRIHQASVEAGERWMLNDVTGSPIRAWDSRLFIRRMSYDELRRPTGLFVTENGAERLAKRTVYGEGQGAASNHRTRVFQVFDGAGRVTNEAYDFKGNLLRSKRDLLPDYSREVDWQQNPTPNDGTFTSSTTYDALNRPTAVTTPDKSVYRPTFNDANLLDTVEVNLRGERDNKGQLKWMPFVTNIDYNAKGQRTRIDYGNRTQTTYEYDKETFRLMNLRTTRSPGRNGLASRIFANATTVQDLRYTYDLAGNITRIADAALATVTHAGQIVEPVCRYTYDAIYRLIEATGREHIDQSAFQFEPSNCNYRDHPYVGAAPTNDLQAVRNFTERYEYDPVGNFERMIHEAVSGAWARAYEYNETSLIEAGTPTTRRKISNRLTQTTLRPGGALPVPEPYTYDAHGNMSTMPHLPLMQWDFEDQLNATSKQVTTNCATETTFYVYDATGQRVRKVTERQNGTRKDERIYLGGFEIYRQYNGTGRAVTLERETLHVMDDQQRIALVETKIVDNGNRITTPDPVHRYQFGNHLGSASLELDKDGGLISYEEYHPYGTTSYQASTSAAEGSLKRYRYTGKERDEETGFSYHGARYYALWLGRWVSCDPLGIVDGVNIYSYTKNNPTRYVDRSGRQLGLPTEALEQTLKDRDAQRLAEEDKKIELENAAIERARAQEEDIAHMQAQTVGLGENWESGGTGAVAGVILANYLLKGVKPNAQDVAALGQTVAASPTLTGAGRSSTPSRSPGIQNAQPQPPATPPKTAPTTLPVSPVAPPTPATKPTLPPQPAVLPTPTAPATPTPAPTQTTPSPVAAGPAVSPPSAPKPSTTKRWKVGDPHDAPTAGGKTPNWDTVRERYWKNKAAQSKAGDIEPGTGKVLTAEDIKRMKAGKGFIDPASGKSMELEHLTPQRTGDPNMHRDLLEVTPLEHSFFDRHRHFADPTGRRWDTSVQTDPRP